VSTVTSKYRLAVAASRPYAGFVSEWTSVGGVRLHARVGGAGAGPRIVLVHGLAVSHRYLMPTAALLGRRHPVAALDLPGFGLSEDPGAVLRTPELADALAGWLDTTGRGPVVLLGNSYGCQVIVDLATRRPDLVRVLVLTGPTTDPSAPSAPRQVLRWLLDVPREPPAQLPILLRDARDAGFRRILGTLREATRDRIEAKLPSVRVPTLVVRGGIEPIVPTRWAAEAARLLPAGELAVLPGIPHNSPYAGAATLTGVVERFLERVT
jgi:pimeloyl-ACP methyl ester carboxylesterase